VTSDSADPARIADGLGQRWEVLNNAYKPYPCGVVLFPVIDACLVLRARLAPETGAIDRVVVSGHPLMRERTDRPNVETGRDARVSLQHTVAAAFRSDPIDAPDSARMTVRGCFCSTDVNLTMRLCYRLGSVLFSKRAVVRPRGSACGVRT
jgi:2-methylcitrate dehydratase PrpD